MTQTPALFQKSSLQFLSLEEKTKVENTTVAINDPFFYPIFVPLSLPNLQYDNKKNSVKYAILMKSLKKELLKKQKLATSGFKKPVNVFSCVKYG